MFPGSVTSVGAEAFINCSAIAVVTIQDHVTSIEDGTCEKPQPTEGFAGTYTILGLVERYFHSTE